MIAQGISRNCARSPCRQVLQRQCCCCQKTTTQLCYNRKIRQHFHYLSHRAAKNLPEHTYPVTILEVKSGWVIEAYSTYVPSLPYQMPQTFESYCTALDPWESSLLQSVVLEQDPFTLIDALKPRYLSPCLQRRLSIFPARLLRMGSGHFNW